VIGPSKPLDLSDIKLFALLFQFECSGEEVIAVILLFSKQLN
jgi:hypothetical protein